MLFLIYSNVWFFHFHCWYHGVDDGRERSIINLFQSRVLLCCFVTELLICLRAYWNTVESEGLGEGRRSTMTQIILWIKFDFYKKKKQTFVTVKSKKEVTVNIPRLSGLRPLRDASGVIVHPTWPSPVYRYCCPLTPAFDSPDPHSSSPHLQSPYVLLPVCCTPTRNVSQVTAGGLRCSTTTFLYTTAVKT